VRERAKELEAEETDEPPGDDDTLTRTLLSAGTLTLVLDFVRRRRSSCREPVRDGGYEEEVEVDDGEGVGSELKRISCRRVADKGRPPGNSTSRRARAANAVDWGERGPSRGVTAGDSETSNSPCGTES
jgi:hypothetical protein